MAVGFGSPSKRRRWCGVALVIGSGLFAGEGQVGAAGMSEGLARGIDKDARPEAKARFASGQSEVGAGGFFGPGTGVGGGNAAGGAGGSGCLAAARSLGKALPA